MAKDKMTPPSQFETVPVKRNEYTPPIPSPISNELREQLKDYGGVTSRLKK